MSKLATSTYIILKKLYPFDKITREYYVNFSNTRLLYDFYIKSLGVCIECQGEQHYKFVKHFHTSIEDLYAQKRRDNLKVEYCDENDLILVYFYDRVDKITEELVLERIYEAMK